MVGAEIRRVIEQRLAQVEREEEIRVLFAVESGSRAWGFASTNSDYDVRFIYVRRTSWYLSIDLETRRDVVERPIVDEIDLSGWDLRKALRLFARSNPPLFEWLDSSIVYVDRLALAGQLRALAPDFFSPLASMHHYLSMARGTFRDQLQGDVVRLKRYFYALRPLLAARWIEQGRGTAPMAFGQLVDVLVGDRTPLRTAIDDLLARKSSGEELAQGPRIAVIHAFIADELQRLESIGADQPKGAGERDLLDGLFRACLEQAWDGA